QQRILSFWKCILQWSGIFSAGTGEPGPELGDDQATELRPGPGIVEQYLHAVCRILPAYDGQPDPGRAPRTVDGLSCDHGAGERGGYDQQWFRTSGRIHQEDRRLQME